VGAFSVHQFAQCVIAHTFCPVREALRTFFYQGEAFKVC
jgi:hypothetical protein